jgi:hypothetical protein
MGEWPGKDMLARTDEELLDELRENEPGHHQSVALQMAVSIRNTQRVSNSIIAASRAGMWLAGAVGAATILGVGVEIWKLLSTR